jgi:type IX secretion system PorP/SprF family membrane protein
MKKLIPTLFCLVLIPFFGKAQQDPLYAQYMLNPILVNPAYTGINNTLNASVSYRNQWGGFEGHPETFNATGHTSLINNKVGAGLVVLQDKIGNLTNSQVFGSAAYKIGDADRTFSFGMQAGMINFRSDNTNLTFQPGAENDPVFLEGERASKFNVGAGFMVKTEKYLFGISAPRLLNSKVTTLGGAETQLYDRTYYVTGAYVFYLSERIRFKPSTLVKVVSGAPLSVDVNATLNFNQAYTVGVYARNLNAYGLLAQALIKENLRIGYAFEVPTNKSVGTQFTSHEIMVGINMAVLAFHDRTFSNF